MLLFVKLRNDLYLCSEIWENVLDFILGANKNSVSSYSKSSKKLKDNGKRDYLLPSKQSVIEKLFFITNVNLDSF